MVLSQGQSCGSLLRDYLQLGAPAVLFYIFSFSSCSPDCILRVRQDAPDVSSRSLTDPTARGAGVRLPALPCHRLCRAGALWLVVRLAWLLPAAAGLKW